MSYLFGFVDYTLKLQERQFKDRYKFIKTPEAFISFSCFNSIGTEKIGSFEQYEGVMDGEIYNIDFLKKSLMKAGYHISEDNDIEIFIKAFHYWGVEAVDKIDGVFAGAVFDQKSQKLFLLRDRVGVKPFFYYKSGSRFLFGTSIKSFYQDDTFQKRIDKDALALYLQYGYIFQPYTIFKECHKLKAGHYLTFDLSSKVLQEKRYWDITQLYNQPKIDISENEAVEETERLLKNAINKRLKPDVAFGSFLSGGYDSSTMAAILQKDRSDKVKTFTIGFDEEVYNEAPYAKAIANHLGTEHIDYCFTGQDALKVIPELIDIYDEPFGNHGAVPTILLSEFAKNNGMKLLFGGEGGDEVFANASGIARYKIITSVPKLLRSGLHTVMDKFEPDKIPYLKDTYNFSTKYNKVKKLILSDTISKMIKNKMFIYTPEETSRILNLEYLNTDLTAFDEKLFHKDVDIADQLIGTFFKTMVIDCELVKTSRALNRYGIELREPFLDIELLNFVTRIDMSLKMKDGNPKHLLKQVVYKYIPKEMLDRPKAGFSIPVISWFQAELKELLLDTLSEGSLKKNHIFDYKEIEKFKHGFYEEGRVEYAYRLWFILIFELWHNKWIKN